MELAKLLIKINSGSVLSEDDIKEIVDYLECVQSREHASFQVSFDDVYEYVLVLGKSQAKEHRGLIEYYLESKDPTTVSLVLEILCLHWGEIDEYLERLIHFTLGVAWDVDGDVRLTSIKILGEHLRDALRHYCKQITRVSQVDEVPKREREVLRLLLGIFEDSNVDSVVRTNVYLSMCRAYGKEWEDMPSECAIIDLNAEDSLIDWQMLVHLRCFAV